MSASKDAGKGMLSPGDRDPSFGDDGIVSLVIPGHDEAHARCVVMLDDYRLFVGLSAVPTTGDYRTDFVLTCLNAVAGSLDQGFGEEGFAFGRFSSAPSNLPTGFCVLPDQQILVYGVTSWVEDTLRLRQMAALALYSDRGAPDKRWGINGTRAVDLPGDFLLDRARPVLGADGRLVLVGAAYSDKGATEGVIAQLNAKGWLDVDAAGTRVVPFSFPGSVDTKVHGVNDFTVDDAGRFIVAGSTSVRGVVSRIDDKGTVDQSFGQDGLVFIDPPDINLDRTGIERIVRLRDGRLLCVGMGKIAADDVDLGMLVVLTGEGLHDPGFNHGITLFLRDLPPCRLTDAAVDGEGRYVVAGEVRVTSEIVVARILPSGEPDRSFGDGKGYIVDKLGGGFDQLGGMTIARDGKIVVCGWIIGDGSDGAKPRVVRYLA